MDFTAFDLNPVPLPGPIPVQLLRVTVSQLRALCISVAGEGGILQALWASDERDRDNGFLLRVGLEHAEGLLIAELPVSAAEPTFPDLADIFPAADRMQRAVNDMTGLSARSGDNRPWLRHAAWPVDYLPLCRDSIEPVLTTAQDEHYRFVHVKGEGVHEIAVGPVHAGIIEPGHFRFSVVGEKVLRLEERLGYTHRGIEKRFESLSLMEGQRLAARISGDSAVAYSWAYCMAAEALSNVTPPARALWLRALCLERERIANHLGDLGALGNDAGFGVSLAQFSRLKEDFLRANERAFGARYLMNAIIPGGMSIDLDDTHRVELLETIPSLIAELDTLRAIYDDHAGLQDRFGGTGRITRELVLKLGVVGLVGRASGQIRDLRVDHPHAPYDKLKVHACGQSSGDVAARVAIRFDETIESLRLTQVILQTLPAGSTRMPLSKPLPGMLGLGWIEGWRGPVLIALEAGEAGAIRRCHAHDPSWQNWPALEHAVIGNVVPDFPLINKSFNLSYSGQDL